MAKHKLSAVTQGGLDLLMHDGAFEKRADGSFHGADWSLAFQYAILSELRVISRKLNALECQNFLEVPSILRRVERNTKKRKKVVTKGKPKLRVVA